MKRFLLTAPIAGLLIAAASPAAASVTIGQVPPTTPVNTCTNLQEDWIQPVTNIGNPYVVPSTGTITSWSTQTSNSAGQVWTMKIFRQVSGSTYSVVGHDGPHALPPGTLNTFQTKIAVKPGDLLGMNDNDTSTPVSTACAVGSPAGDVFWRNGSLADGAQGSFTSQASGAPLNIRAVFEPTNTFSFGAVTRNRKRGTATITVTVPNAGDVTASGNGVKAAAAGAVVSKQAASPGDVQFLIKAKGQKKHKLFKTGKVKVKVRVTYTPTGGKSRKQSIKVKLRKR